jgi:thiol:disulfide interchange protein
MAVPMALTALALLWLLWRLSGDWALLVGAVAAVIILVGAWSHGRRQRTAYGLNGPTFAALLVLTLGVFSLALYRLPVQIGPVSQQADLLKSEAFTAERLTQYRAERRNIFVYFTADWCVTCKINEAAAIDREETKRAFEKAAAVTLKGDFTRRDPAIARFLAEHGRSGVPLYLYYPKGGEPQVLPQILTVQTLTDLAQ